MALQSDLVQIGINSKQAEFLGSTNAQGVTATGTTKAAAAPILKTINLVETCVAGVNDSVVLPSTTTYKGDFIIIQNSGAGVLQVWPESGEYINVLAVNTATTIASGAGKAFYKCNITNSRWITVP